MIESYSHAIVRWRYLVIFMSLLLIGLATLGIQRLTLDTNYRVFFAEGNPQLTAFDTLQNTYTKTDNVLFMVIPKDGDVFDARTLSLVHELTEAGWHLPFASRVDSISNYQHTVADDDELVVEDVMLDPTDLSPERMMAIRNIVLNEPMLVKRLVSPEGHVVAVNVTATLPQKDYTEVTEMADAARVLRDQLKAKYPEVDIKLTGMVMMNAAFGEASANDITLLVPIMMLVVLACLAGLLRSISGTVNTLLIIIFSIMAAMGIAGWLDAVVSPPVASGPTIILTMAVADAVHLLVTMRHNMRLGMTKHQAIAESVRINFMPVFITSVTTAIGFLTMNFSEAPPFHTLGNLVAVGVTIAFILSITLLPALAAVLPMNVTPQTDEDATPAAMDKFAQWVINRRKQLYVGTFGVTFVLLAMIPFNEINDNFVEYFDRSMAFRQASDFGNENLISVYNIEYSLKVQEKGGISEPKFLNDTEAFANWLRGFPEVQHVSSITDTFKRLNKNMHADDPAWYKLPQERELAAQYLLLYELSLPYGLDLNNQLDTDKSATRLVVTFENQTSQAMLDLESKIASYLQENMPYVEVYGASPATMFSHIGQRNAVAMLEGTLLALILISFILVIALRSMPMGMLSLAPNLIPTALAFGIWGLFVGEVGISLATAMGMTLGIVVDYTVHFLSKYLRARREQNHTPEQAVRYAFNTVGVALLVTTLVLVAGFVVLAMSSFKMNSDMGVMTAMTIAIALIVDFLFLPALLMKMDKKERTEIAGDEVFARAN